MIARHLVLVLAVGLAAAPAGAQDDAERENLTDIREINVIVERLTDDAEEAGLSRRALSDAIEERLEERGVPLGNSRSAADLYVNVATVRGSTASTLSTADMKVRERALFSGSRMRL